MISNLLALTGVLLIIAAVAALAGGWYAVGLAGAVLLASAWAAHQADPDGS